MSTERNVFEAIKYLTNTWNAWADCVEKVFRRVGDQSEDLEVSEDQYISFIHMVASTPARPTQRPLKDMTDHEVWFIRTMPNKYLDYFNGLWNAYADKLEKTHLGIAAELGRCTLLTSPFETKSTRGLLHGILRSMLGPGRLFHGVADARAHEVVASVAEMRLQGRSITRTDHLVSAIESMSLYGGQGARAESAEELLVRLENMSIDAGTS